MKKVCLILFVAAFVMGGENLAWSQYKAVEITDGGAIRGQVLFSGEVPAPKQLKINQSLEICGKTPLYDESLIVSSEGQGLKNTVVRLTEITTGKAWPPESELPTLDQNKCRYDPHVMLVPVGAKFDILNNDGTLHNIHTRGEKNRPVNRAHPKLTKKINLRFRVPEFVRVSCDVHHWMQSWIVVTDHPYYSVTDDTGSFEITDIPPGTYSVEFWHEKLGVQTQQVTVEKDKVTELGATFSLN